MALLRVMAMAAAVAAVVPAAQTSTATPAIRVSANQRFLQQADGKPFFWVGDTGWLMFQRLTREETETYLENRRRKGFNVIQAMVLNSGADRNAYGAAALADNKSVNPVVTPGKDPATPGEYDYWDHVDWVVDLAASKGIYVGMVPSWGALVKRGQVRADNVEAYARFLAERYGPRPNVIWLIGGDIQGDQKTEVWNAMARTIKQHDPQKHLMTFHPFGRMQSSTWFHNEAWLDFNMFQSGHKRYDQDPQGKGEDNWRYVLEDYARTPPKPTLDGEPSYEAIPQGLHDPKEPRWKDRDVRRYAYWSVFAGSFGHTYGHNSVMQMLHANTGRASYGGSLLWDKAIDDPGAGQMQYLKNLMISRPYFERVYDPSLVAGEARERYERVMATRGGSYAFFYTYTGQPFEARLGKIRGAKVRARWYSPRDGSTQEIGTFPNRGTRQFAPPGTPGEGNDWVLILDDAASPHGR